MPDSRVQAHQGREELELTLVDLQIAAATAFAQESPQAIQELAGLKVEYCKWRIDQRRQREDPAASEVRT